MRRLVLMRFSALDTPAASFLILWPSSHTTTSGPGAKSASSSATLVAVPAVRSRNISYPRINTPPCSTPPHQLALFRRASTSFTWINMTHTLACHWATRASRAAGPRTWSLSTYNCGRSPLGSLVMEITDCTTMHRAHGGGHIPHVEFSKPVLDDIDRHNGEDLAGWRVSQQHPDEAYHLERLPCPHHVTQHCGRTRDMRDRPCCRHTRTTPVFTPQP